MCHFRIVTQVKMYLPKGRQSGQNAHKVITVINDRCTRLADKYGFIFLVEEKALSKKIYTSVHTINSSNKKYILNSLL